ncbi:MAG: hypothetical protein KUG67_03735 [Proteobacteria bacterium]|nr:hypothetical protein [Pseudomonadota bacterium]
MFKANAVNLVKLFSLPIILYVLFLVTRISDIQFSMESELGDFITSLNFLFGSFLSYFIFIFHILSTQKISSYRSLWWWAMCIFLALLAFDELYMIHEFVGHHLAIKDTLIFLFYGGILGVLLLFKLEAVFTKDTFIFLVLFTLLSLISQISDYLYNEGIIVLMNREISYEQLSESFGALCLTCAITTIAIRQLVEKQPEMNHDKENRIQAPF